MLGGAGLLQLGLPGAGQAKVDFIMNTTVILCTYNRGQSLAKALESLARSEMPSSVQWDVLVVDNNSKDDTREVVEGFCERFPGLFRYVFEPRQGKSYALNTGIREARGDVLAFTDDDVFVEPTWLQNLTAGLLEGKWAGAGGRVASDRSFSPPRWFPEERYVSGPLVMFDLGENPGELTEPPFGANMAFRKEVFANYGGFRVDLGPRPGSEIRSEDTELGNRLLSAGERLRYEPSAVVYHAVPASRLERKFFLAWWFAKGRADMQASTPSEFKWRVANVPVVLLRRFLLWTMRWLGTIHPGRRFTAKLSVWVVAGRIIGCFAKGIPEAASEGVRIGAQDEVVR